MSPRDYAAYLARHGSQGQRPRKPRGSGRVGAAKRLACEVVRAGGATKGDGWIELTVPVRTYNPTNGAQGRHWSIVAGKRRRVRDAVAMMLFHRTPPEGSVVVLLTRIAPRMLDDDNLRPALKNVRDEVADWLGVDDGDVEAVEWRCAQEKAKGYGVRIRVETKGAVAE